MDCTIEQEALSDALQRVKVGAHESTLASPVFSLVKLTAGEGMLRLVAGNVSITATTSAPARVEVPGSLCVPLRRLRDSINVVEGNVRLRREEGNRLRIGAGAWTLAVAGRDAADFPSEPAWPTKRSPISRAALRFLLARTFYVAARKMEKPEVDCVHVTRDGDALTAFAMDTNRLARARVRCHGPRGARFLLDRLACEEVLALLETSSTDVVGLHMASDRIFVQSEATELAIAKIPGTVRPIPSDEDVDTKTSSRVSRTELMEALTACKKLTQRPEVWIDVRDGGLTVSSDPSVQETSVGKRIPSDVRGPGLKLCAHAEYLRDVLGACEGQAVVFGFGASPYDAITVRAEGDEDAWAVLMPMQVNT